METINKKTSVAFQWCSDDPANEPVVGSEVTHPVSFRWLPDISCFHTISSKPELTNTFLCFWQGWSMDFAIMNVKTCWSLVSFSYSMQIQMYQLSRLLHDYHRDLYNHLEAHEIGPSLYAAPWFLTMFASQFPLGFVSRVFGNSS